MKGLHMLVWLSQLGLNTVLPLTYCMLLSVYLKRRFDLGVWVVIIGLVIGLLSAIEGFRTSLRAMERMEQGREKSPAAVPDKERKQ